MDRKLIAYEPLIMQPIKEIQSIMGTEQPEIESLWSGTERVLQNQFIADADRTGLSRWEAMLHINPKGTNSLQERRFTILARLNQQLPHTMNTLNQRLTSLCGEDNYAVILNHDKYYLEVQVSLAAKSNFEAVAEMLEQIVPANLVINLTLKYRTHKPLTNWKHEHLNLYTHDQLRNEVIK